MNYQVKTSVLGKRRVVYACPKCETALDSALEEAGKPDKCPECETSFTVPGAAELQREREKLAKERQTRDAKAKTEEEAKASALEAKRIAAEEAKLRKLEDARRAKNEAERRKAEEIRRAKEKAELRVLDASPPAVGAASSAPLHQKAPSKPSTSDRFLWIAFKIGKIVSFMALVIVLIVGVVFAISAVSSISYSAASRPRVTVPVYQPSTVTQNSMQTPAAQNSPQPLAAKNSPQKTTHPIEIVLVRHKIEPYEDSLLRHLKSVSQRYEVFATTESQYASGLDKYISEAVSKGSDARIAAKEYLAESTEQVEAAEEQVEATVKANLAKATQRQFALYGFAVTVLVFLSLLLLPLLIQIEQNTRGGKQGRI